MCYDPVTSYGNPGDPWATRFAAAEAVTDNICVPPGTYNLTTDITLHKNWQILDGASIQPGSGVTVTFAGSVQAGLYRFIDLSTGGVVAFEPGAVEELLPHWWGARGDVRQATGGSLSASSTTLTTTGGVPFQASDVGKVLWVPGAGAAGTYLVTTIQAYVSPTQVTVATAADTTVSGQTVTFGSDDTLAVQAAMDAAIEAGISLYCPGGTYLLNPAANGGTAVNLHFTRDGQTLHVRGAGRGVTTFLEKARATAVGGENTKMFYLYITTSIQIDTLLFSDLTFDKNGASNGTPPSPWEWEQAHILSIAGRWGSITPSISLLSFQRTGIRDKVGAGYHCTVQMPIHRVEIRDFTEEGWTNRQGERGDIEITCWSRDIGFSGVTSRYIQTEPLAGYEAGEGRERYFRIVSSRLGVLQLAEPDASADYARVLVSNCEIQDFSTRGLSVQVDNSDICIPGAVWAKSGLLSNCTVRARYVPGEGEDPGTIQPIYVRCFTPGPEEARYPQQWSFTGCFFTLDTPADVQPTGSLFGRDIGGKMSTVGDLVMLVDACRFDARLETIAHFYGVGEIQIRNSKLACWGAPALRVGGYSTWIGRMVLSGNDYSGCAATPLLRMHRNNTLWELQFNERLALSQYTVDHTGSGTLDTTYTVHPTLLSPVAPPTTAQRFYVGDAAVNPRPGTGTGGSGSPVTRWVCTADGAPGTWHAAEWVTHRGTTASRPVLGSYDVGVTYLDTTLDADGKLVLWTGTAWVDASGAVV